MTELVHRWFEELFSNGNLAAVDGLLHPDFVAYGQGGGQDTDGRERFREWLRWYTSSFADPDWRLDPVLECGDRAVVRYTGRLTYRGWLLDIPSRDQRVTETGTRTLLGLVQVPRIPLEVSR